MGSESVASEATAGLMSRRGMYLDISRYKRFSDPPKVKNPICICMLCVLNGTRMAGLLESWSVCIYA